MITGWPTVTATSNGSMAPLVVGVQTIWSPTGSSSIGRSWPPASTWQPCARRALCQTGKGRSVMVGDFVSTARTYKLLIVSSSPTFDRLGPAYIHRHVILSGELERQIVRLGRPERVQSGPGALIWAGIVFQRLLLVNVIGLAGNRVAPCCSRASRGRHSGTIPRRRLRSGPAGPALIHSSKRSIFQYLFFCAGLTLICR